jgi:outer membrane protein assembly factor BamC
MNRFSLSPRFAAALLALLAGCSSLENKKIDYKSESQQVRPLEVPPDLSSPNTSDRFTVPDGSATYSELNQNQQGVPSGTQGLLPQPDKAHIERAGTQRWLVVEAKPEQVWPVVKEFWQELGFIVVSENPEIGIMETDWAENRAKIPQGAIRNVLGKVLDQAYSSPERDKFRTRLERGQKPGATEIYVSHRGMYEVYVNDANLRQTGRTVWQPRPADPELEAEMLRRLMIKFAGGQATETALNKSDKAAAPPEPRAVVSKAAGGTPVLMLKDDFDRAWRRVGLSLDRLGFTVQDRDRAGGMYYVRYLNPESEAKKPGLLSRLKFWDSGPKGKAEDYRIVVAEAKSGSEVQVMAADGKPDKSSAASRILAVLQEDLK